MRWITEEEPVRIYATGHIFGRGKPRLSAITDYAIDEASISVAMSGGHHLQMYLNWGMPEGFGEFPNGHWMAGPELALKPAAGGVEWIRGSERTVVAPSDGRQSANTLRITRFADAVAGRCRQDVSGEDGLIALRCSYAALESIESGKVVLLK